MHKPIVTLFLAVSLILMTLQSQAQTSEVQQVERSDELFEKLKSNYIGEFSSLINQVQLQHDTSYSLAQTSVSDSCVVLMSKENFAGPTGRRISQVLMQHNDFFPNLIQGRSLNRYCRNYSGMSLQQKSLVWVLVLTVIAHFESSCNEKAHAKGPNGTAYGYFQQHAGQEDEYHGNRSFCRKNSSRDPVLAGQCTLSMLEYQFNIDNGELFNNKSYWDVLRPNGRAKKAISIQRALTQFSLCQPKVF